MKKFLAILLSVMLVLAFSTVAFAAYTYTAVESGATYNSSTTYYTDQNGTEYTGGSEGFDTAIGTGLYTRSGTPDASITINANQNAGTVTTEFHYYELLKASINGDRVVYYLPVSTEGTALKDLLSAVTYTNGDGDTVTPFSFTQSADGTRWNAVISDDVDDGDGELLAAALNTNAIKAAALDDDTFAPGVQTEVDPGYYLITSTLGTNLVLETLGNETINTKNEYITCVKTENMNNMEVGEAVTYTITVTIPETAVPGDVITVHDTLDSHLAILDSNDEIAASAANYNITATTGGSTSVTLTDGTAETGETFAKSFTVTQAMITNGSVVLTYKAELLSTAAADTVYTNTAYASSPAYTTATTSVDVYTFDIDLDKTFTGVDPADAGDYSATFELRTTANDASTAISFIQDATGYVVADSNDTGASPTLTVTGANGINIRGLDDDTTYYLVELSTSEGFNLLTDAVAVTITDTSTVTNNVVDGSPSHTVAYQIGSGTAQDGTSSIEVVNNSGSQLPSTGGIGTTIFYIVGAILVLGAGILIIAKRRSAAAEQ